MDFSNIDLEFFEFLHKPLFTIGQNTVNTISLVLFVFSFVLLFFLAGRLRWFLVNKILVKRHVDYGVSQAIGSIFRYLFIIIGLAIIIQTSGVDLSFLAILAGALGVGIGFGLQNITNNFVSGIIILFERPIKVGDRVEVGDVSGDVVAIHSRATTIITNNNIAVIVPNSEFISEKVINWSYNDRYVRFNFPVGVSYNEDPQKIKRLLLEVASENKGVLDAPPPDVLFSEFGDSSLDFDLRVWTLEYSSKPKVLKSQLYYAIFEKFKEHGIEIPFPQRDLHLRTGFESLTK